MVANHFAPSELNLFWEHLPGALPQALTLRAFGAWQVLREKISYSG